MNEVIKLIKDAYYRIPADIEIDLYSYQQGLVAGRKQALEIIKKYQQDNCEHVYGSSDGACLNCSFQA